MNLLTLASKILIIYIVVELILIFLLFNGQDFLYPYFTYSYSLIAVFGGLLLIIKSSEWDSFKSNIGSTFLLIGTSLLFQYLGQLTCNSYRILGSVDKCPYPSFAEIFFVGSIFLYIYASYLLSKSIGLYFNFRTFSYKFFAIMVSITMVVLAYYKFADINEVSNLDDIKLLVTEYGILYLFLELIYPFGAGVYTTFAIISIFLSTNTYKSKLFVPAILILIGLFSQFMGDTLFVWTEGYISDLFYLISYSSLALIGVYLSKVFVKTKVLED